MISSWLGHGAVVGPLLQERGEIDARSNAYGTALNIAALRKEKDITGMLVRSNAKAYILGREYNILHVKRHPYFR